jgi:thiol:disulfide interchange protein
MKPVVDRLEKQYEGKVEFRVINVEKDSQGSALMDQFNAQYVPTFVFINTDGSQSDLKVGELKQADLEKALDALR